MRACSRNVAEVRNSDAEQLLFRYYNLLYYIDGFFLIVYEKAGSPRTSATVLLVAASGGLSSSGASGTSDTSTPDTANLR